MISLQDFGFDLVRFCRLSGAVLNDLDAGDDVTVTAGDVRGRCRLCPTTDNGVSGGGASSSSESAGGISSSEETTNVNAVRRRFRGLRRRLGRRRGGGR